MRKWSIHLGEIILNLYLPNNLDSKYMTSFTLFLLTMPKSLTVWITTNCGKFFKRWEYQTTLPASWEIYMQVKKQQLELYMQEQTASKSGKVVYCHPAYLTYMQSTSCEILGCIKHKLESRLPGEISIISICRWHHTYVRRWRKTKEPLDESESGEWKSWLKTQHSENQDRGIWSYHFMANR